MEYKGIVQKIRQLLEDKNIDMLTFSKEMGFTKRQLDYLLVNGKATKATVSKLCQYFGVGENYFEMEESYTTYMPVPNYSSFNQKSNSPYALQTLYMEQMGCAMDFARIFRMRDNSMAPAIEKDDALLVDLSQRDPNFPGYFLLSMNDQPATVRKIQPRRHHNHITVKQIVIINPATGEGRDYPKKDVKILGKVLEIMRHVG